MMNKFLFLAVLATMVGGCDKYNRADISHDGKTIAFSLGEKGFIADATSELYFFDVETCSMKRQTFDDTCEGWVSFGGIGVAYSKSKGKGNIEGTVEVLTEKDGIFTLSDGMANTPVFLPNDKIFFSSVEPGNRKEARITFNVWYPYNVNQLIKLPADPNGEFLCSTLPAFFQDQVIYYAIADVRGIHEKNGQFDSGLYKVTVYRLEIGTKKNTPVTTFEFQGKKGAKDFPVGYVDLAISPDDKTLVCCFLPPNKLAIDMFSDKLASTVYLVDVATGKQTLFRSDKNMYYPKWKGRDKPKFVYLSGTGYQEGRGVWITDLSKMSVKLADLPDKVMQAYTGWTWLTPKRVRIFHIGKSGLILVDVNEDGTEKKTRIVSPEKLKTLKEIADLEGLIKFWKERSESDAKLLAGNADVSVMKGPYEKIIAEMTQKLKKLEKTPITYERK